MPSRLISGEETRYALITRLGRLRSRSGRFGEEKKRFPLPGLEPLTTEPILYSPYRLRYSTGVSLCLSKLRPLMCPFPVPTMTDAYEELVELWLTRDRRPLSIHVSLSVYPTQILHELPWERTTTYAVRIRRLTALTRGKHLLHGRKTTMNPSFLPVCPSSLFRSAHCTQHFSEKRKRKPHKVLFDLFLFLTRHHCELTAAVTNVATFHRYLFRHSVSSRRRQISRSFVASTTSAWSHFRFLFRRMAVLTDALSSLVKWPQAKRPDRKYLKTSYDIFLSHSWQFIIQSYLCFYAM
jgi:hypothetical protein